MTDREGTDAAQPAPPSTDHPAGAPPAAEPEPVVAEPGDGPRAPARRRRRQTAARPHRVLASFADEEFGVLAVAAARAGLTVTGYVAGTAVAVAKGEVTPLPAAAGDAVRELVAARQQLRRYGTLLNQAVAKLNATGQADAALLAAVERCDAATREVSGALVRVGRPGPGAAAPPGRAATGGRAGS